MTFFFNNKNAIQGNETKQRETFHVMYPLFVTICCEKDREIISLLGHGMNTSITKVVDNAIVGYSRTALRISGEVDDRLAAYP